jgi:hypothetical protein
VRAWVFAATVAALALSPTSARANGAVLAPTSSADPTTLDIELAVAVTPYGTTRWTRLTVGSSEQSAMWLVPVRPGAALDWANEGWLTALEDATLPRVAPPSEMAPCGMPSSTEEVASWSTVGPQKYPHDVVVLDSAETTRTYVTSRGYALSTEEDAKVGDVYARGYALVSLELDIPGPATSSPTLRISDDGAPIVPLALTGSTSTVTRVTALVVGPGPADLPGARELASSSIVWDFDGSSYAADRASALAIGGGAFWIRESSSHDVVFDGVAVPRAAPIQALSTSYFRDATGEARPTCEAAAYDASRAAGIVGQVCAPGALLRVPGGATCMPTSGPIDPAAFACGPSIDDLALALSGTEPGGTFVTRFTGIVSKGGFGVDGAISDDGAPLSPVVIAGAFAPCPGTPPSGSTSSSSGGSAAPAAPLSPTGHERPHHYHQSGEGCGSSTTIIYDDTGEEDDVSSDSCGSTTPSSGDDSTDTSSSDDSSDSCDSSSTDDSTSSSDDSDDSSWDDSSSDDSDDSDSDDSCDCGKSSTGSSSGEDDDTNTSSQSIAPNVSSAKSSKPPHRKTPAPKPTSKNTKHRGRSPVSRGALLFVALLLPLRRRMRVKKL